MAIVRIPVELTSPALPSPAINVWHARIETAGDLWDGGVQPYSGALGTLHQFYQALLGLFPSDITIKVPNAVVDVQTQEEISADPLPALVGTGVDVAPRGLAVVVGWKTSIRARRGTGRTFVGPLTRSGIETANGTPGSNVITPLATAAQALIDRSAAVNGWALGVWGQETANVPGVNVLRDFTSFKINDKYAHLRTRRD